MNHFSCLLALLSLLGFANAGASAANSQRILKAYQEATNQWSANLRLAATPEERAKISASRPDATATAVQVWADIGGSLDQEWTLEPAAWFLRNTPGLVTTKADGTTTPAFAKENETIRKAIESYHLSSPKLIPICAALASSTHPQSPGYQDSGRRCVWRRYSV